MFKRKSAQKGVALFVVLATLLIVIILANIILAIISSQSRLTHHQVSRIQAYYAAMAAWNLAYESLRRGLAVPARLEADKKDGLPYAVDIKVDEPDANGLRKVTITVDYTYTPPSPP